MCDPIRIDSANPEDPMSQLAVTKTRAAQAKSSQTQQPALPLEHHPEFQSS